MATLAAGNTLSLNSLATACDESTKSLGTCAGSTATPISMSAFSIDAVSSISVDLDKGKIGIVMKQSQSLDDSVIEELIVNSGFNLVSIHRCDS